MKKFGGAVFSGGNGCNETDEVALRILHVIYGENLPRTFEVLFVPDFKLPSAPPFSIKPAIIEKCTPQLSLEMIKRFIYKQRNQQSFIIFPINGTTQWGAVSIAETPYFYKGFRPGMLDPIHYWFKINKSYCLPRLTIHPYNVKRISDRTSGQQSEKRKYWIGGLGSIGSNLVYFLNSEQNISFVLADDEKLTIDNIGRHLLGFSSVGKSKVDEIKQYILSKRPEREVYAHNKTIEHVLFSNEGYDSTQSALFLCTGNTNTERYVLEKLKNKKVDFPIFLLWLEPYAIAGHMVYINPKDCISSVFLETLYPYNLVASSEYETDEHVFTKQESGCAASFTYYGGSDVVLFLSAMYPKIQQLIKEPTVSSYYRWVGNIEIAREKGITLSTEEQLCKGSVQSFLMSR